jgi:hypothetical protein
MHTSWHGTVGGDITRTRTGNITRTVTGRDPRTNNTARQPRPCRSSTATPYSPPPT